MYQRCNIPRIQNSLTVKDDAPTTFDIGAFTPVVITVNAAADTASVAYTNTDAWAGAVGGALIVSASRPQNPSIGYFKGPYQLAGKVAGAATPPTSPAVLTLPFPVTAGNAIFFQVTAAFSDGRYSAPLRFRSIAA
jgi:hypothetical protein